MFTVKQPTKLSLIFFCLLLASCWEQKITPVKSLEVARQGIHGGRLSNSAQYALIGSIFHGGSLWRLSDGERLYNWNHSQNPDDRIIISADISTNDSYALTADAASIVLWKVSGGEAHRFWTSPAEILDSRLSDDGRYAILGLADHSAVIFDIMRGGLTRTFRHKGRVRSIDIANNIAISGSEDHTAVVWSINQNAPLLTIEHDEDVQLVRLSHDGSYALTAAKYDRAEVWNLQTNSKVGVIPLKKEQIKRGLRITSAAFSKDNRQLLLGFANRTVELRDANTLTLIKQWRIPSRKRWQPTSASVLDVAFDRSDGQYWIMNSDGMIYLIN